jgi:branched-chain amino acid transport system ATP-binding protein
MLEALAVMGVTKHFGGFLALNNVNLHVAHGAIHGLIGTNGAGKTTLLQIIAGHITADSGRIGVYGKDITKLPTWRRIRVGIGQSFQVASVFNGMTVRDNVQIAAAVASRRTMVKLFWPAAKDVADRVERAIGATDLGDLTEIKAANLSQGDRKRLELALVVAQDPTLLLLDEPTAGMSRAETDAIVRLLSRLRQASGLTMLVVEHDMDVVFNLVDSVTVLHQGAIAFEGTPKDVAGSERVRDIYLGNEAAVHANWAATK